MFHFCSCYRYHPLNLAYFANVKSKVFRDKNLNIWFTLLMKQLVYIQPIYGPFLFRIFIPCIFGIKLKIMTATIEWTKIPKIYSIVQIARKILVT